MTIRVKNIQYFDWKVPEELIPVGDNISDEIFQQLIDEHVDSSDLSIIQSTDDYYEFEEVL